MVLESHGKPLSLFCTHPVISVINLFQLYMRLQLLTCSHTVPISLWHGMGMHSAYLCHLILCLYFSHIVCGWQFYVWMFEYILVPAHPGSPGQNPECRKMVVVVVYLSTFMAYYVCCRLNVHDWCSNTVIKLIHVLLCKNIERQVTELLYV